MAVSPPLPISGDDGQNGGCVDSAQSIAATIDNPESPAAAGRSRANRSSTVVVGSTASSVLLPPPFSGRMMSPGQHDSHQRNIFDESRHIIVSRIEHNVGRPADLDDLAVPA